MEKLLKLFKTYKNAIFILLGCIVITLTGSVFTKGDYYNYNYERQILKDCDMQWYDANDNNCANYKEKQRKIDDEEINASAGQSQIPAKSPFDYIVFLSSILQVVFVAIASFILGNQHKADKLGKLYKAIPAFLVIMIGCIIANGFLVLVNGVFSSNDLLRVIFEIIISVIMFILGKKL